MIETILDTLATVLLLRLAWAGISAYAAQRAALRRKSIEAGLGGWFADVMAALVVGGQTACLLGAVWS